MKSLTLPLFGTLVCLVASAAPTADAPTLRLPNDARPVRYAADLTLDPAKDSFSGTIEIDLELSQPASTLWLNGSNLAVRTAVLRQGDRTWNAGVKPSGQYFLGFTFPSAVPAGKAKLSIAYDGKYNLRSSGGLFKLMEGSDPYLFTQFEPLDARQVFPCFDEPSFKVPWQLTLRVPKGQVAVANTPVEAESDDPSGLRVVRFRESKPLSSYLVAVAVGPFEFVDAGTASKNRVPVRIITPKGKAAQAKYAAEVTGPILDRLEAYFGIPYPYEKLDSIAIPLTYGFGAMENAGLVTYASNLLLADPALDSISRQRGYASVCAHELAHQWFGNLVTMAWWDDTWLNEAFATWMSSKIIEGYRPEWDAHVGRVNARLEAMNQDSLTTARQIRQPIESNDDVANAFDSITYRKGAAVIHMMERWIGDSGFQAGVRGYMRQYAFRNAATGDFLDALTTAGKQNVTRAFNTFLTQPGVPLLTAEVACGSGNAAPSVQLTQRRSLPVGSRGSQEQSWQVPVGLRYSVNGKTHDQTVLLSEPSASVKLQGCPEWLSANPDGSGYYRVLYRGDLLSKLLAEGGKRLNAAELVSTLGDAAALMESGDLKASDALRLVPLFANHADRQVTEAALDLAASVKAHLVPADLAPNYARFLQRSFGERARRLGWRSTPADNPDTKLLRGSIVELVAVAGQDEALAAEARSLAGRWLADRTAVEPELVASVLRVAAQTGDAALYDRFLAAAKATQDRRQRGQLLTALGQFRDPALVQKGFAAITAGEFDLREAGGLLFGPLGSEPTRRLPYEFVKANFEPLVARMPSGTSFDFGSILPRTAASFCSVQDAAEAEAFFGSRMGRFTGGTRNLAQATESIRLCAALRTAQQASVAGFLKGY